MPIIQKKKTGSCGEAILILSLKEIKIYLSYLHRFNDDCHSIFFSLIENISFLAHPLFLHRYYFLKRYASSL